MPYNRLGVRLPPRYSSPPCRSLAQVLWKWLREEHQAWEAWLEEESDASDASAESSDPGTDWDTELLAQQYREQQRQQYLVFEYEFWRRH